jgi:hypothetical protein
VRYVVADTGNWLSGRQVLISPYAFGGLHQVEKILPVHLTRKQIENSPAIESHKPVSRQYEDEYHRYYGWPDYWQGAGIWGLSGFPILAEKSKPFTGEPAAKSGAPQEPAAVHLRSAQAISGYHLQAGDDIIGHVCDFMMDYKSWAIIELVVKIGPRFTGKEVRIPISQVARISYDESTVFVKLTKEAVENSPEHRLLPDQAGIPAQPLFAL